MPQSSCLQLEAPIPKLEVGVILEVEKTIDWDWDTFANQVVTMTSKGWLLERALFIMARKHKPDKLAVDKLRNKVLDLRVELGMY